MTRGWLYLLIAAVLEIGWPLGFKLSQTTSHRVLFILLAAVCMTLSGFFLWLAQKVIPELIVLPASATVAVGVRETDKCWAWWRP